MNSKMLKKATSIALCAAMLMANAFTPFTAKAAEVQEPAAEERAVERKADDGIFDASDISVQLYSIRSALNPLSGDYEGIKGELQKLGQIGYQNMEPYSRLGLTAAQWLQLEQETGLHISSWHQGASAAEDPAERDAANAETAAFFAELGLKDVFINYGGFSTAEEYAAFMERIRAFREAMKAQGIGLNFHTHDHEFQQAEANGELAVSPLPIDEILAALDVPAGDTDIPEGHVAKLELDVHWAARAGYNPVDLIKKYADRLTYLHMKDLSFTQMSWGTGNTFLYEELGEGTLDIPAIIKAGREAGVLYYVVEQDGNFAISSGAEDPYASVRRSYNYLSNFFHSDIGDANLYPQEPAREAPIIRDDQLSIQLYTVRSLFSGLNGNYDGIKNVLQQIADIGIKNVELYSFHGLSGAQWKRLLEETGLHASSMHQGIVANEADVKVLVKNLKEVGLDNIFYPNGAFTDYEGSAAALDQLDQFRKRMEKDGIKVNYHTHSQEYTQKLESDGSAGSRVVLDDIIEDGAEVELDVHWATRAGRNPIDLINTYANDVTYLHIKDLGYTYGRSFVYEEIGSGVLDMDAIIQAGNAAGVRYYVIEQDGNYLNNDPLASVRRSYDYIKEHYLVEVPGSISLSKTNVSMKAGETLALSVTTQPEGAAANAVWSTSNSRVANVDGNGQVTAASAGSAVITCTVGELSAQCAVLVNGDTSAIESSKISLQLYTLRDLMSARAGMPGTEDMDGRIAYVTDILKQVASIGYKNVEPYSAYGISAADWKRMAQEAGVTISSWHQGFSSAATAAERKEANEATAQFFEELGLGQIFINYGGFTTQEAAETFLSNMAEFKEVMEGHNICVGFHTHNHEFQQDTLENGELNAEQEDLILDRLLRALDSEKLNYKAELELDVHWAARAGRNPVDVIKKYQDRVTYLHMKDLSLTDRNTFVYEELGDGTLDIPAILQAGMEAGVKYYVVEQDSNWYLTNNTVSNAYDYMRSIKASFDYLQQFFGKDISDIVPEKEQRSNPQIKESQLSVQLYSVRDRLSRVSGDYDGIKAVLQEISDIGYKNVEMYNFLGLTGVQWKRMLQETGLNVSSIHQNILTSESQIKTLVQNLKGLGLDNIFIANGGYSNYATSIAYVEQMNAFSKRLGKDGIKVNYHTHNQEYSQRFASNGYGENNERATLDSHIVLDDIVNSGMSLEIDTHWAARAGRNPADVIDAYADAAAYLHIKDLGYGWGQSYVYEEIGSGQLDMDEIIMAGNAADIQYYVVEQDSNFMAEGSMASIKRSYEYIRDHYFEGASALALNKTNVSMKKGDTLALSIKERPAGTMQAVWASSNANVATVDEKGLVTAVNAGAASITCTIGAMSTQCAVLVNDTPSEIGAEQISLQLYTLRDLMGARAGMPGTEDMDGRIAYVTDILKQVASIGYKNVEPYSNYGISASAWKKMAEEAGVTISSWHQGFSSAATAAERKAANEATAQFFEELGLGQIFINYGGFTTQEAAETFLSNMAEFKEVMESHNIRVGFHTHNHEFQQDTLANGELNAAQEDLILDRLLRALDSEKLNYKAELELDVHWAARAGRNPVDVIKKYQDRVTYLHMKDLSLTDRNTFVYEELGDGALDIPAILQAGMEAGVKYYVVEQDSNWYLANNAVNNAYDYMGSIKASFDYLRQFFGKDIKDIVPEKEQRSNPQIQESQLSVQLYSVRDRLSQVSGDYNGIKAVLQEISDIGYKNVEMYNFLGLTGVQWKKLLQETGLNVSSIHQNVLTSESQIKTLVQNLKGVGLDSIFIASGRFSDYETSIAFVEQMNAFSKRLGKDGIKVNYHTHNQEYAQRFAANGYGEDNERATVDSHTVLDDIVNSGMSLEIDTHWAARAGRNPADVIDAYADAATYLHIKDLGYGWGQTYVYEEIGSGQLDMDEIIMAGNAANIQYYVVEQDSNFTADGSMASIKRSYDYIKAHYLVIPAKSISLNRASVSIKAGATSKLTATIAPSDATDKSVSWASSNQSVATVNGNGVVTGKKAGTAVITATANTGKVAASCKVTVTAASAPSVVAVKSVTANMASKVLKKGKKVTLKATVLPSNATNKKVTWKSSKPKIASVNSKGVVTAKKKGTATITAAAGGKKATVKVYVGSATAVSKVAFSKTKATVKVKKSITLKAAVRPANAKYKGVTFTSSNAKVAKVNKNGKVTGVKAGKATITVTTKEGGKRAKCVVTVKK